MALKTVDDRREVGLEARRRVPREAHAEWRPAADRVGPIVLLSAQNEQRVPWLVPVRHTRMRVSPFTFYRGTASIMATDLATTPDSGFQVQAVGDGHLSNLGAQAKEANASVLEPHLHASHYAHHGQRVVEGQRQIQAQSDICLGWATGPAGRTFYVRQLRDWKRSFGVESATPRELDFYARLCGQILARGHARSGDSVAMAAYMGDSSEFDEAILAFSERYADQTFEDYERFSSAITDGTLPVADDV